MDIIKSFKNTKYILVIAGFSYLDDSSGTSKVIKAHEGIFMEAAIDYIVIYPVNPINKYTGCYWVCINGEKGIIRSLEDLLNMFAILNNRGVEAVGILVHHLLNHNIQNIKTIIDIFDRIPIAIYLHDFYTCCPNFKLLYNDLYFCAKDSIDCNGCKYSLEQKVHYRKMVDIFNEYNKQITFVSPSVFTQKIWKKFYSDYQNNIIIIPHLQAIGNYTQNMSIIKNKVPIKVAYIGAQDFTKGWTIYKNIIIRCQKENKNYSFYYFGSPNEKLNNVVNTKVKVHKQGKDAMINALREKKIDVVIMPAVCPETYSYTLYEAMAANCFILTTTKSGNVTCVVKDNKFGEVLENFDELLNLMLNESKFRTILNDWRGKHNGALSYVDNKDVLKVFDLQRVYNANYTLRRVPLYKVLWRCFLDYLYKIRNSSNNI